MTDWRRWQSSTSPPRQTGPRSRRPCSSPPSRLHWHVIAGAVRTAGHAARALGLRKGPVYAELRVTGTGPAMLELAARSIPDGDRYLGFIFAEAGTPDDVEKALTSASQRLRAVID